MREIDPLREPSEALLSAALHRLAKGSPAGAPEELGANLAHSFRQHHAQRRRARVAGWSGLAACVILAAIFAIKFARGNGTPVPSNVARQPQPVQPLSVARQPEQPVAQPAKERSTDVAKVKPPLDANQANQNDAFVPLPSYDPAVGTGDLQVVRLELSGADLRLVGAPVAEDLSDRRILADVVVGRDGTPYAVRFVQ